MELPNDLKNYGEHRQDAFALFTPEEAGGILLVMFFGAVAFDLLSRLASWMFG